MAKYKVENAYTGNCDTTLQGDGTIDYDDVLQFKDAKILFYATVCTQAQAEAGIKMENADLIGFGSESLSFGRSRSTDTIDVPESTTKWKTTNAAEFDETSLSYFMTEDNYPKFKKAFNDDAGVCILGCYFKNSTDTTPTTIEAYYGKFSAFKTNYNASSQNRVNLTYVPTEELSATLCLGPDRTL